MTQTDARTVRESVYQLLTTEIIEIDDAASRMGLTPDIVESMWDKSYEIRTAERFLGEMGLEAEVMTLAEFVGTQRVPGGQQRLDNVCPDVVAVIENRAVGIELTAYSDNPTHELMSASMRHISEFSRRNLASRFPELRGSVVFYDLIQRDVLPKRKAWGLPSNFFAM